MALVTHTASMSIRHTFLRLWGLLPVGLWMTRIAGGQQGPRMAGGPLELSHPCSGVTLVGESGGGFSGSGLMLMGAGAACSQDLHKKYSYIRKTRPDGNCFYRAFGFSHLEALLDDSKELQRFKAVSAKSKEDLVSQGFTEFTIEDFHNTFMDLIEQVEKQTSVADLLASFNDQSTSDYLVVYLRLLTSGYLQRESKFFEHFIEGGRTVKEFCQQEVEPMCKESDHIHIIALAQALSVSIQGMLAVSRVCACPCSAAAWLAACVWLPPAPQVGSSRPSTCPCPSLPPPGAVLRGLGLLGTPPGYWGSTSFLSGTPALFPSLAGPGTSMRILEGSWFLVQGPRITQASSCTLLGPDLTAPRRAGPGPRPEPPALPSGGLHAPVLGGDG
uniref:ubiquitinyl hydrolase 1 n=1 Tax=Suricata suricatta TaxID=37032 RepID=A0A673VBD1_SURSU